MRSKLIYEPQDKKENMCNNEKMAYEQSLKIEQMKRSLLGSEAVGKNITRELHGHTDKLKDIIDKTNKMEKELDNSNTTMKNIEKLENKCLIF